MKKVAIFYCKRIKDHTCIACAKCFKGIREKNGEFAKHDEDIEIVSMTDCGDCPGLIVPRVKMINGIVEGLGGEIDAIHLGTCIQMAYEHGKAINMASHFEIDDVIDPADSRHSIMTALRSIPPPAPRSHKKRACIDTW